MIKRQLIEAVVKYSGQPTEVVTRVLDTYMSVVRHELVHGGSVEVRGFGKFHRVRRKAKLARRMTGKPGESTAMLLPARSVVQFRVSDNWDAPVHLAPTPQAEREKPYAAAYGIGDILKAHRSGNKNNNQF